MRRSVRENGPALCVAALLAVGLKLAYSRLGSDQFTWITGPTQALVSVLTGVDFTYEAGYGYVNLARSFVIAKSCAGVNYLLAVFGMLAFTLVPAVAGQRAKLVLLGSLTGLSYATAVVVNSLRIALGLALRDSGLALGGLTPERAHRILGIGVYFLALCGVHALARAAVASTVESVRKPASLLRAPMLWYGLVALAVPLANGALLDRPALFVEHCAFVLAVTLPVAAVLGWLSRQRPALPIR